MAGTSPAMTRCVFSASLQPALDRADERLADSLVLHELQRLAEKCLDQEALGHIFRQASGHEVKQEILVELSAGGAVGALHVVGEDFEFRLVVHGAALLEEERRRHHAAVGLLGMMRND